MENHFFKNIENKTGVNMNDILELAGSLQNANFSDERTVRGIVRRVAQIANKPVSREMENKIVQSIVKDGSRLDMNSIAKMLNNKR
ncbi:MAG TPA: stage VI sporulation protein F [Bacillaceae bacterium]